MVSGSDQLMRGVANSLLCSIQLNVRTMLCCMQAMPSVLFMSINVTEHACAVLSSPVDKKLDN